MKTDSFSGVIYKCTCIHNNKKYYGYTKNFSKRIKQHLKSAEKGKLQFLYRAIRKYGEDSFLWEIVEHHENEYESDLHKILCERESYWILTDKTNDPEFGYNMTIGGDGGSFYGIKNGMFGKKHKLESLEKISNTLKEEYTDERRLKHSIDMMGENNPMFGKNSQSSGIVKYGKDCKGKSFTEIYGEEKAKEISKRRSLSLKGTSYNFKILTCPHCKKQGRSCNMTRYHFDNCKAFNEKTKTD